MYTFNTLTAQEADCAVAIWKSHIEKNGCTWDNEYPSHIEANKDIAAGKLYCLRNKQNEPIAIASVESELELSELPFWRQSSKPCEIARIAVRTGMEGNGLAFQLLSKLFTNLSDTGYTSVRLLVAETNMPARALYTKLGFQQRGTTERYDRHWLCMDCLL